MGMLLTRHYADNNENKAQGVAKEVAPSSVKPVKAEKKEVAQAKEPEATITEAEIKKMTGTKLRKLAKEKGIFSPEEYTVAELKAILCDELVK